ncbi:MAG: fimbrillin family protein [Rikenellaceae bacterium]|jgi:hypothetical protein|nr:fimbrillin family protein [Rikenellaceae bacterium]
MKKLFVISALLLSAGCVKKDFIEEQNPVSDVVSFVVNEMSETRGTPINDAKDLTSMGVFCAYTGMNDWSLPAALNKMSNEPLDHNGSGKWNYRSSSVSWGNATLADRFSFFAYSPFADANNGLAVQAATQGIPALSYTVPTAVDRQPDLMVAVPRYNLRPTGSPVGLSMKHALTCVGFQIAGNGEKVVGISISGVSITGRVAVDGSNIAWSNLGAATTTDFSASINFDPGKTYYTTTPTMSTSLIKGDGYLMMIPQALSASSKVKVTMDDGSTREISLDGLRWEAGKKATYAITITPQGTLTVDPLDVALIDAATTTANIQSIRVLCQDRNGNDVPSIGWSLATPDTWLLLTTSAAGTGGSRTISGNGSKTIYLVATRNTSSSIRTGSIAVNDSSGATIATVTVRQLMNIPTGLGNTPTGTAPCVGAFWRANQTGERIINIPMGTNSANLGAWSATVYYMDGRWNDGDIVLSTTASADPGVNTASPGNAENYPVNSNVSSVSGTVASNGSIYFRIGLKSTYTPTTTYPARYAVVVVTFNNNAKAYRLYLRQGENADYLMHTNDRINSGGMNSSTRPQAKMFSPYNLTAPSNMWASSGNSAPQLSVNGGVFADYPSQAGAFFQWAGINSNLIRRAFHPYYGAPAGTWSSNTSTGFWNALSSSNETCPNGYRRPTDGPTNTAIHYVNATANNSEYRQSIYYKPEISSGINVAALESSGWGFYADGFYDRQSKNGAMAGSGKDVAYTGMLYFNPVVGSQRENASIFFPVAGYLNKDNNGTLINNNGQQQRAFYASSTVDGTGGADNAFALFLYYDGGGSNNSPGSTMSANNIQKGLGFSIRCVKN